MNQEKVKGNLPKGKKSTRMPVGTWTKGDSHPTVCGLFFNRYTRQYGTVYEQWSTQEKLEQMRIDQKLSQRIRRNGSNKLRGNNCNTGSTRGTFKLWDKHPFIDGMFFKRYETRNGILRENWCNKEKMENAKQYELLARLNRRVAIEGSKLEDGDEAAILDFYAVRDAKNRAHGRIMYHVDHRIPLAKEGTHHPSNLQLATAIWNLQKGAKLA
jgi:hypothetical protein